MVKESAEGRELARADIRTLLTLAVDIVVHMTRLRARGGTGLPRSTTIPPRSGCG